jgi:hypothetical protein
VRTSSDSPRSPSPRSGSTSGFGGLSWVWMLLLVAAGLSGSTCTTILGDDFVVEGGGDGDGDSDGGDDCAGLPPCDECACYSCPEVYYGCLGDAACLECAIYGSSCDLVDPNLIVGAQECFYNSCPDECGVF